MGKGVIVGGVVRKDAPKDVVRVIGFVKPESTYWVAVSLNMCLVGQGRDASEAIESLMESVVSYIKFVQAEYPRDWREKLEMEPPSEFIEEFRQICSSVHKALEAGKKSEAAHKAKFRWSTSDLKNAQTGYTFVQPVATAYA